mmetsp:Transcript_15656/g.20918  ORF Transcript_15656/g.20918 Transcript_15656/m.20918 type:complete len:102 (-) Transcript_15656:1026-1331(-)
MHKECEISDSKNIERVIPKKDECLPLKHDLSFQKHQHFVMLSHTHLCPTFDQQKKTLFKKKCTTTKTTYLGTTSSQSLLPLFTSTNTHFHNLMMIMRLDTI